MTEELVLVLEHLIRKTIERVLFNQTKNLHPTDLPSRFAQTTADAAAIRCPDQ